MDDAGEETEIEVELEFEEEKVRVPIDNEASLPLEGGFEDFSPREEKSEPPQKQSPIASSVPFNSVDMT
ncbi:hypothetical protein ON010_g4852 [Phytophthora cinnamomi]|nr:hypothetical protein ON010_g4852 [Phytophthora cinnamomi]